VKRVKRAKRAAAPAGWIVCDAGALFALERGSPKMRRLLTTSAAGNVHIAIPAGVLAQAWRGGTGPDAIVAALVGEPNVSVIPLDRELAMATGVLCKRVGTRDVVDASIVILARKLRAVVVSTDPDDLLRLDPTLELEAP